MEERNTSRRLLNDPTLTSLSVEFTETSEDCQEDLPLCDLQFETLHWLIIFTAVVGMAGNVAVLWLLGCRTRRSAVSVYILNLAAADFIILCYYISCIILENLDSPIFENPLFLIIFNTVVNCSYTTGLSMLSAISTERCLSTLWPIRYRCRRPKHTSAITCGLLWAIALLLSLLTKCSYDMEYIEMDIWCLTLDFFIATYLIILFVLLSGSNLALVVRIFCGSHRIRMTRLCVTILLTVLVFLFCGLPVSIYYFLGNSLEIISSAFPCYYHTLSVFLSCVNSSANPIIYFFVGSFRQRKHRSLKQVLQKALQDTPERDDLGGSPPPEALEMSGGRVEQG